MQEQNGLELNIQKNLKKSKFVGLTGVPKIVTEYDQEILQSQTADKPKAVLLLWIICVFVSCASHAFASVQFCLVVTCWERSELFALVGDVYCIFLLSHVVSWVRCGT